MRNTKNKIIRKNKYFFSNFISLLNAFIKHNIIVKFETIASIANTLDSYQRVEVFVIIEKTKSTRKSLFLLFKNKNIPK